MPIPNPIQGAAKTVKKVPPKVAIVAVGGGVVFYIVYRSHKANTDPAATTAATPPDQSTDYGSPYADSSTNPGVYPVGSGQGAASLPPVDFSGDSVGIDGLPAIDDTAVGSGGSLGTLNIVVGTAPDGSAGTDATPGPKAASNGAKTVKTRAIKTLADLPIADRNAINAERKAGKVDRFGRTPTERRAARENTGIAAQLRARLSRSRQTHRAGGGPTTRQHPSKAHGAPKRPIRGAPKSHVTQPKTHTPVNAPNPPHKRKPSKRGKR